MLLSCCGQTPPYGLHACRPGCRRVHFVSSLADWPLTALAAAASMAHRCHPCYPLVLLGSARCRAGCWVTTSRMHPPWGAQVVGGLQTPALCPGSVCRQLCVADYTGRQLDCITAHCACAHGTAHAAAAAWHSTSRRVCATSYRSHTHTHNCNSSRRPQASQASRKGQTPQPSSTSTSHAHRRELRVAPAGSQLSRLQRSGRGGAARAPRPRPPLRGPSGAPSRF